MSLAQGTKAPFYQSAAPVGWAIDTAAALANAAVRIVTSAGGVTGGTDTFAASFNGTKSFSAGAKAEAGATTETDGATATGSHVLTVGELPSHDHDFTYGTRGDLSSAGGSVAVDAIQTSGGANTVTTQTTGSGSGHTHTIAQHTHPIAVHTHDVDTAFDVKFADLMICTRD